MAPGTSAQSNPNALASMQKNTIFTNVALTRTNDVWWEGLTEEKPARLVSWLRNDWTPGQPPHFPHWPSPPPSPLSESPFSAPLLSYRPSRREAPGLGIFARIRDVGVD